MSSIFFNKKLTSTVFRIDLISWRMIQIDVDWLKDLKGLLLMGDQAEKRQILIANDHAGVEFKAQLLRSPFLTDFSFLDMGVSEPTSVDYPDIAQAFAHQMKEGAFETGILICGSGIGVSMAANRFSHIRAALCHDVTTARLARQHNNANVLVMGARITGIETALDMILAFMSQSFEGGRHQIRVDKLNHLTKSNK